MVFLEDYSLPKVLLAIEIPPRANRRQLVEWTLRPNIGAANWRAYDRMVSPGGKSASNSNADVRFQGEHCPK